MKDPVEFLLTLLFLFFCFLFATTVLGHLEKIQKKLDEIVVELKQ